MATIDHLPPLDVSFVPGQVIRFSYRNWQGTIAIRTARITKLVYGAAEWHPEPQWLLQAVDLDKEAVRLFALKDMAPVD